MDNLSEQNRKYKKSNFIISSKYRSSLVENKIMAISLAYIDKAVEKDGKIMNSIPAATIKKLLGKEGRSGGFYERLFDIALGLSNRKMAFKDPENDYFEIINLISKAVYKDGTFTIYYDAEIKNYLTGLKKNFTPFSLSEMLSFDSVYSFRIYELLKSEAYKEKYNKEKWKTGTEAEDSIYRIAFSIAELKLDLGIVNTDLYSVQSVLHSKKNPDFEKAVAASPEKMYSTWRDLKRWVIDVAVKEINEKSTMHINYDLEKSGRGGKVQGIIFYVEFRENTESEVTGEVKKEEVVMTQEQMDAFHDMVRDLVKEKLTSAGVRSISEAAGYDFEKVKKAYEVAKGTSVQNMTAFLISAIKNNFEVNEKKSRSSNNTFNHFPQREYDFEQLELEILAN